MAVLVVAAALRFMRNVHLSAINASHTIRIGFDAQRAVCTISFYRLCSLVCVCAVCVCMRFQTFYQIRCPLIGLLHAAWVFYLCNSLIYFR